MLPITDIPRDTHLIEVRQESYGFTVAHRFNGRVLFVANYPNKQEALRNSKFIAEREQAEGNEVILASDPRLG